MAEQLVSWIGTLSSSLSSGVSDATQTGEREAPPVRPHPIAWPPFEVVPGDRLGELVLGTSAQTIARWLQAQQGLLQLDIEYTVPSIDSLDLCFTLWHGEPSHPFLKLHFGGRRQRLCLIEVIKLGTVELTHDGQSLVVLPAFSYGALPSEPALTMQRLCDVFGGQGVYTEDGRFTFWQQGIAAQACLTNHSANATGVERMMLYQSAGVEAQDLVLNRRLTPDSDTDGQGQAVVIQLDGSTSGALFTVLPEDVTLQFGMQVQDVLASIGSPDEEYDGLQDGQFDLLTGPETVYVHNYFRRGFDVVYRACAHVVAGVVMHTNFAGDQDFGLYERCRFSIFVDRAAPGVDPAIDLEPEPQQCEMPRGLDCLRPESSQDDALDLLGPSLSEREKCKQLPLALNELIANGREDPLGEKNVLWWEEHGLVVECMAGTEGVYRGCRCITKVTVLPL